jgi:hypothetical protein
LRREGFRVLRISNNHLDEHMSEVIEMIQNALGMPTRPTLAAARPVPPHRGEGNSEPKSMPPTP